jgi:hypothetical protein
MRPKPAQDRRTDAEKREAEAGADKVPHAEAEALHAEPSEGNTRQETADLLGNLFRTSKEEADNVERRHEKRVRNALEQGRSQVRPNQK